MNQCYCFVIKSVLEKSCTEKKKNLGFNSLKSKE